jgi:hypothetical protein
MKLYSTTKMLAAIAFVSVITGSCNKDDNKPAKDTAYIRAVNTSSNNYSVVITGGVATEFIQPNTTRTYTVSPGTYTAVATQKDGYVLWPTQVTATIVLAKGDSRDFIFP